MSHDWVRGVDELVIIHRSLASAWFVPKRTT